MGRVVTVGSRASVDQHRSPATPRVAVPAPGPDMEASHHRVLLSKCDIEPSTRLSRRATPARGGVRDATMVPVPGTRTEPELSVAELDAAPGGPERRRGGATVR